MVDTLKPVHVSFKTFDNDSTHTAVTGAQSGSKAIRHFKSFGSTSTHASAALSGFEYYEVLILLVQELMNVLDLSSTGRIGDTELGTILDTYVTKLTKFANADLVPIVDTYNYGNTSDVLGTIHEHVVKVIIKFATELLAPVDSQIGPFTAFDATDCGSLSIGVFENGTSSGSIKIEGLMEDTDTTNVVVTPYNLVPVTNASSTDNPYTPSVGIDGILVVESTATTFVPPVAGVVIVLGDAPVGHTTTDQVFASSINLSYQGGSFSFKSTAPLGTGNTYQTNIGTTLTLLGFLGTITDWGENLGPNGIYYETEGIFGPLLMHRSFETTIYALTQGTTTNEVVDFLGLNASFNFSFQTTNNTTTVRGMAELLARAAGIQLTFAVTDAPYLDSIAQLGSTVEEALSSLAGSVGGTLRWNGNNSYLIAYPTYSAGIWVIPSVKLMRSVIYKYHLDLSLDLTGTGTIGIPTNVGFNVSQLPLPQTVDTPDGNIQRIGSLTKALTADDPPFILDLPDDMSGVKIQILVPSNQFIAAQYVTASDSTWFDLGDNSSLAGNPFMRRVKVGDSYRTQIYMDYLGFPTLNAISNGNFSMNFGITRASLAPTFEDAQTNANLALRILEAKIQANVRYIKTYTATITLDFFGSIPTPGMSTGIITLEGRQITGIIESVSVNNDTTITIEVAQYLRINFLDRKLEWELGSGHFLGN